MDKVTARLKSDAEAIRVSVSPELDDRIRASLEGIAPEAKKRPRRASRPLGFWLASTLTGVAAALALLLFVIPRGPESFGSDPVSPVAAERPTLFPGVSLKVQPAVLTRPLEQEYADLQSDLRKAEKAVTGEIDEILRQRP